MTPQQEEGGVSRRRNKPPARWNVQPLQKLEADVPLAYEVEFENANQVAVTLSEGQSLLIDAEGNVRNEHGSHLFRLAYRRAAR
jgi:hypothetical protein